MASRTARRPGLNAAAWFAGQSFHRFLIAPSTSARLNRMIEDNRATDARILAERDEREDEDGGAACGTACGFCGRCS